ncbi:MAG: glycosyltransferase family 4 protein, partial [Phycisphaerales bacterium]|nr:glycosyltransferase family 4 protein [Phycisphaerales bacterium]
MSRELAPFYHGGIGTYVAQFARALIAAGHDVHILTEPHEDLHEKGPSLLPGVVLHAVNVKEGVSAMGAYPTYPMRHAMGVYQALKHLHKKYRYDCIETPDYWGEGYFVLRAKKTLGEFEDAVVSARLHSPAYLCREFDRQYWLNTEIALSDHMEMTVVREADVLVSPSRAMLRATAAILGDRMPTPEEVPQYVVPLPMDVSAVQRDLGDCSHDPHNGPGAQTILLYGRMQYLKGVHLLVEAGKRLMARGLDVNVRIIGGDTPTAPMGKSMREWLGKKVEGVWKDRIILEDRRPRTEIGRAIHSATVCCFPSLFESFSMVCVEAMAVGAAVVGSDAGGIGE